MQIIQIEANLEQYEIGAKVISTLVYPLVPDNERARQGFAIALCYEAIKKAALEAPDWAHRRQTIIPAYLLYGPNEQKLYYKQGFGILSKRLVAARMARPLFQQVSPLDTIKLPIDVKILSVTEIAKYIPADESGQNCPDNLEKRVWRTSTPVIHVALALETCIAAFEFQNGRNPDILDILLSPGLSQNIIAYSQIFESLLPEIRAIKLAPERFIRLRMA